MTKAAALDWANSHLSEYPAIGLRGDDVIPKRKFRKSHHRPDGEDAGIIGNVVCAVGIRHLTRETDATQDDFDRAYQRAKTYGRNIFLLGGDYADAELANDVDERWIYGHKIIAIIED